MLSEILNACRQGRADVEAYIVADAVKGASLFFCYGPAGRGVTGPIRVTVRAQRY